MNKVATHTIALFIGFIITLLFWRNIDADYELTIERTNKFAQFCELNGMGTLKSYDKHTFTCNSGKEIPINLLLGRD